MNTLLTQLVSIWRHHLTKLIALSICISLVVGMARRWLGYEQSALIGLLTGIASVASADFILSSRSRRKLRWDQAKSIPRENWYSPARMALLVAVIVFASGNRELPSEPFVAQVLELVETIGLFVIILVPLLRDILLFSGGNILSRLVFGLAAYSVAIWLIGAAGDEAYLWITGNPHDAAVVLASLVICWAMLRVCPSPTVPHPSTIPLGRVSADALCDRSPTGRDIRYIAAHEAGHALIYAALGGLPADFKLAVNKYVDDNGVLGFVTGIKSTHKLDEKSFVEWRMLTALAGKLGESVMHGESTVGSSNDHLRWLEVARTYLANHYRGMYYLEPQNKFEQEQNESKLEALQADQLLTLNAVFDRNIEVFKQLVDTLQEKRTMGRHDIAPFLASVKLPAGFPLPFGPFERFNIESALDTSSKIAH